MERPFRQILDIFNEFNQKNKDVFTFVFEKSDSISLWIIGLSIGAISIIANDIGKIKATIPNHLLSVIVYLLAFSVTTGILYRIACLSFFVINNQISMNLEIDFSKRESMDVESYLTGNETYEQLLKIVKEGFEDDFSLLIPVYQSADDEGKKILHTSMVKYYLGNVSWAKQDRENAIDFAMGIYASYEGIT